MGFWTRFGTAWKAATDKHPGANPADASTNRVPKPGRYGAGMYPTWRAMLQSWWFGAKVEALKPEDANDGIDNSIVAICITWIMTSWLVAVPQVGTLNPDGSFKPLPTRHQFLDLLDQPQSMVDEYSNLMWSVIPDFIRRGNGYLHILRGNSGEIIGLEHVAARFVRPIPDEMGNLSYYSYDGGGEIVPIPIEDMIHLKHGSAERFPLMGVSPLAAQYREIITDNAYSDYSGGLAKGGGIPQIVFSPRLLKSADGETMVDMTKEDAEALTESFSEKIEAEPGKTRFVGGAVDMHKMGIDPDKMALNDVRAMPETRIPAALGLPALLLQLYTGIQKATFNNLDMAIKQGWRGCIIPMMEYFARRITACGLHQYPDAKRRGLVFRWDYSHVKELQEDQVAINEDSRKDFESGIMTLEEVRSARGMATTPAIAAELAARRAASQPATDPTATPAKSLNVPVPIHITKREADRPIALADAVEKYRKALRNREASALLEMSDALEIVEKSILADLDALTAHMEASAETGEQISESWLLRQERYESLLSQIETQYTRFADQAGQAITDVQRGYVDDTTANAFDLATAAVGQAPDGVSLSWNSLPTATIQNLVGAASDGSPLSDVFRSMATDTAPAFGMAVKDALIAGVGAGYNPRKTAALMRQSAEAKLAISRNRAETIARTETMRAARETARQTYAANSDVLEGWVWTSALGSRTCASCYAMHGSIHAAGDRLDDHCNGRCVAVPRTKSWASITGNADLPDTRPIIDDGETIFAGMHDSDQKAILGDALHTLYADGSITLADCVVQTDDERWGTMRRAATVEEAKANAAKRTGN